MDSPKKPPTGAPPGQKPPAGKAAAAAPVGILAQARATYDQLFPPETPRRKFGPFIVAAPFVILVIVSAVIASSVNEKREEISRARAEERRVQTTGVLFVKSNLPQAEVEAVRVVAAGESAPTAARAPLGQALANLAPGKYAVTLRAAGWPDTQGEIDVPAGRQTETAVNFPAGALRVESTPAGATVKWNRTALGKTPLVIPLLPPGEVLLSLEYPSWPAVPLKAAVTANVESTASVRLPHGRLTVDSFPAGAVVVLDGKSYKQTPLFFDPIAAGPKKLTLQAKDFPPLEVAVTITDGQETKIRPLLGLGFPPLDPPALMRDVWVVDDKRAGAPAFNSITNQNRPRNDIVRNVHRQVFYDKWQNKTYRFSGRMLSFDASTGTLEFEGQRSELAPYRVTARIKPGPNFTPPPKGAELGVYGRLTDVLESAWPLRVVTFELADAEILPPSDGDGAN